MCNTTSDVPRNIDFALTTVIMLPLSILAFFMQFCGAHIQTFRLILQEKEEKKKQKQEELEKQIVTRREKEKALLEKKQQERNGKKS